ncbi:MAG: carbohydrate ABC transporter permease, partial [Acidimicrobiia bacterium]
MATIAASRPTTTEKGAARKEAWIRRLPLLPALLFTIVVTQLPFLLNIYYSLTDWKVVPPTPRTFNGLSNYGELFTNQFFREAVVTSAIMVIASVVLAVLVGMGLALLLDREFFGRGVLRTLLITPFLMMPVVAALIWKHQVLNAGFGILNWVVERFGGEPFEFVSRLPLWSVVAVLVWEWSPFMMLIILAGLSGQSTDSLEAARVDGASSSKIFFNITLPQLRPFIELGALLGSIYLIQVFDEIQVLT